MSSLDLLLVLFIFFWVFPVLLFGISFLADLIGDAMPYHPPSKTTLDLSLRPLQDPLDKAMAWLVGLTLAATLVVFLSYAVLCYFQ